MGMHMAEMWGIHSSLSNLSGFDSVAATDTVCSDPVAKSCGRLRSEGNRWRLARFFKGNLLYRHHIEVGFPWTMMKNNVRVSIRSA